MYLLGYDIGSSSIKASLVDVESDQVLEIVKYPDKEMAIHSAEEGWAEQDPEIWWKNLCVATQILLKNTKVESEQILSIGISYQMHGLVLIDRNQKILRPAIIWCDSRAVEIGNQAFNDIGKEYCLEHLLNSPGNFTASKLKWVSDNEPEIFKRVDKFLLPGDYIAMKLTGIANTTISGLSEGIFWDFKSNSISEALMNYLGFNKEIIPSITDNFKVQGRVSQQASDEIGISVNTPVTYRAGDQVNNAMSLSVNKTGEFAATGGTSGVIYGITSKTIYDKKSRINAFAHVNHRTDQPRIGLLMCINGAGILYSWLKSQIVDQGVGYTEMENMISKIPIGSEGLRVLPFGNGAERILNNMSIGSQINNLQFNIHTKAHLIRAALEGIAFSFVYGFNIMLELGLKPRVLKVGNDNLFQSDVFSTTIAELLKIDIQIIDTTGAVGAAKASGIGIGIYKDLDDAFAKSNMVKTIQASSASEAYQQSYALWKKDLQELVRIKNT